MGSLYLIHISISWWKTWRALSWRHHGVMICLSFRWRIVLIIWCVVIVVLNGGVLRTQHSSRWNRLKSERNHWVHLSLTFNWLSQLGMMAYWISFSCTKLLQQSFSPINRFLSWRVHLWRHFIFFEVVIGFNIDSVVKLLGDILHIKSYSSLHFRLHWSIFFILIIVTVIDEIF